MSDDAIHNPSPATHDEQGENFGEQLKVTEMTAGKISEQPKATEKPAGATSKTLLAGNAAGESVQDTASYQSSYQTNKIRRTNFRRASPRPDGCQGVRH